MVDEDNLQPTHRSHLIFDHTGGELAPLIHAEFFSSMLEAITPVLDHIDDIKPFYDRMFDYLYGLAEPHKILFMGNGIHPQSRYKEALVTRKPRYQRLHDELKGVLSRFIIQGLHVHVGLPNAETAIHATNLTNKYLPILLALSASSPFHEGDDTGLHSYRSKLFETLPRTGITEFFEDYEAFTRLVHALHRGQAIQAFNEVWWDARIRPDFGTLELRACDAVSDIRRIQCIAALFQGLCKWSEQHHLKRDYHELNTQNKWCAARYGMDGRFIRGDRVTCMREAALELIEILRVEGVFSELKTEGYIEPLKDYINGPTPAAQMVDLYNQTGDFEATLRHGIVARP